MGKHQQSVIQVISDNTCCSTQNVDPERAILQIVAERSTRKVTMLDPHELTHKLVGSHRKCGQDEHDEAINYVEFDYPTLPRKASLGIQQEISRMEDHIHL